MSVQLMLGEGWQEVRDGNDSVRTIFNRHYSRRRDSTSKLFIGPGSKFALITADGTAISAWRKQRYRADGERGVECTIFRREDGDLASALLSEAMAIAWRRWPGERLFTFVDPRKVQPTWRASRPTWGHVFYLAGWRFVRVTAKGLHVLEALPRGLGA